MGKQKYMLQLARNLRFLRTVMLLKQDDVAEMMETSRYRYTCLELGTRQATPDELRQLKRITGIDIDALLLLDLRCQMMAEILAASKVADVPAFANEYLKLSDPGRELIQRQMERIAAEENEAARSLTERGPRHEKRY